jgi:hypothetical protein
VAETEEEPHELPISHVGSLKQINGGAQAADTYEIGESDIETASDQLMESRAVQRYLTHYHGDSALTDDLSRMVASLISEPQGNGVSKMNAVRLSYQLESGYHKKLTVWHLNPNRRTGLTLSDTGRETRIYYVLAPVEGTDTKQLLLLSVLHKNDAAKIRSSVPSM